MAEVTGSGEHQALMLAAALALAARGWEVFPLTGKVPAILSPHPRGMRCRGREDGCGLYGHGVLDASADPALIAAWWRGHYAGANIGGRVPAGLVVLDVDPRSGGAVSLAELEDRHGPLPPTLTAWSGRGDGGRHFYFVHPGGTVRKPPGRGLDLKTHGGYCVLPPSIHPDTGGPYSWDAERAEPLPAPPWLVDLMRPPQLQPAARTVPASTRDPGAGGLGPDLIGEYNRSARWGSPELIGDWACLDGDGEHDGARWLHPDATSACSATVRDGRLYVYSTSTAFEATDAGTKRGYSKFDAFMLLRHGNDRTAALTELSRRHAALRPVAGGAR